MAASLSKEHVVLSGNRMRAEFRSKNDSWYLSSLTDKEGDVQVVRADSRSSLWAVRARLPEGDLVECRSAGLVSRARTLKGIDIIWDGFELGEGSCRASLRASLHTSGLLSLDLALEFSPPTPLWEVDFPIVDGLVKDGSILYAPYGYGKAIVPDKDAGYERRYPSHYCTMQFLGWKVGSKSLYMGCHDSQSMTKDLCFSNEQTPRLWCTLPVPGMGEERASYRMPYSTLLGPIQGDWYDLARFYREWALSQRWSRAGRVSSRSIPQRLKDVALWCQASGKPEDVVSKALEFGRFFDVPVAMHWYNWHEIPFDTKYPEYFPPKRGFKDAVAKLSKAGILVMPYINARLWDPSTASWGKELAERYATKDQEMEKYVEVYGSKVPLSPMCPTTSQWRDKIGGIVGRLAAEYRVDGIYLDQISAAPPRLCFDQGHGHEAGGGGWWVEGYRRMLDEVRREIGRINPSFFITTESNAEPWMDQLDALLMCNSTEGDLVPMYPAVYGDRILTFGAYIFRSDLDDSWAFRAKVSQMFLWGTQLGWLGFDILDPKFRPEAEYLRSLARTRVDGAKYLADGEMLRIPRIESEVPHTKTNWELWNRSWLIQMPMAQATAWRGADGSIGIAACNMDDHERTPQISLSLTELCLTKTKAQRIINKTGLTRTDGKVKDGRMYLNISLEPRSADCFSSNPIG